MSVLATSLEERAGEFVYIELLGRVKLALDSGREISIPASEIRPYPDQPRKYFNPESIKRLSNSIASGGQTTPGLVRKNQGETPYELIDGERRWRAVALIPENVRPLYKARLIEAGDDVVRYLISGIANFNREGHTSTEIMDTIDRLRKSELPMEEIANLLGISLYWAYQMHGLKNLDADVLKLLDPNLPRKSQLPVVAAVQISKVPKKFQLGFAHKILRNEIPLPQLRREIVKVAAKEGATIRMRQRKPKEKWTSFCSRIDRMFAESEDIEDAVQTGALDSFLRSLTPQEKAALLKKLQISREALARTTQYMQALRK